MNTLSTTTTLLGHSLAWALLYSLWQGLIIYALLFVLLKAMPGIGSRIRYFMSISAFAGLFIWFADTWLDQYEKLKGTVVYISNPVGSLNTAPIQVVQTVALPENTGAAWHRLMPGLERYYPIIMLLYCIGLAFMIFRFIVNVWQVRVLRSQGVFAADASWNSFVAQAQRSFDIARPVTLRISTKVNVPMMMGIIKPVILLPVASINNLSTEQVEAILLHELAHIRRHDYLVNMLQTIGEAILFFNPFVWLISAAARREREHCCDDMVVANAGNPLPYARALAVLETSRLQDNDLALAATGHNNQLFNRIKRIMEMKKSKLNYSQLTIILLAFVAISFMIAMFTFTPSFAQKSKKTPTADADTTKKTEYHYKKVTIDADGNRTEEERVSDKPIKDESVTTSKNGKTKVITKVYTDGHSMDDKDEDNDMPDVNQIMSEVSIATRDAGKEVAEAMAEVRRSLNEVDWDKIFEDIDKGIAEVDKELNDPKLRKQIKKELEHSREAMETAKQHVKEQMSKMKEHLEEQNAHRGHSYSHSYSYSNGGSSSAMAMPPMPPAAVNAPAPPMPPMPPMDHAGSGYDYESMLKKMEKEGLIDRSHKFSVRKEDGDLYINGDLQPESVYRRYRPYLKDERVSIKGNHGSLAISVKD